jgi:hypothetical protein
LAVAFLLQLLGELSASVHDAGQPVLLSSVSR